MSDHIWLQITSGRGPGECQLGVAHLARVVLAEGRTAGFTAELIDSTEGNVGGGLLSALLSIAGEGADRFARRNTGSVQWVCPSPLRPGHKRKNWFVAVDALTPPASDVPDAIRAADVTFEAMRASGPGGQHVNKTESAVRATHRPSGLVATAREERSQAMNKRLALARLAQMLASEAAGKRADADRERWSRHDAIERGQPARVFKGPEFREAK